MWYETDPTNPAPSCYYGNDEPSYEVQEAATPITGGERVVLRIPESLRRADSAPWYGTPFSMLNVDVVRMTKQRLQIKVKYFYNKTNYWFIYAIEFKSYYVSTFKVYFKNETCKNKLRRVYSIIFL